MPIVNVFAIFGTSIYNNFYPGSIIFTQQVSVKEPEFSKKFRLIFNLISKQNVVINRGFLVSAVYLIKKRTILNYVMDELQWFLRNINVEVK